MRRFVTLLVLLLFSIPFGISLSGCSKVNPVTYCDGSDSGLVVGQATTITLTPKVYGISLNYAEIGQISSPATTDCKGTSVSVNAYIYGTSDMTIADVQPGTGRICGGTWNRNTPGGIPDYTTCNPTGKSGTAYISASSEGVTSNPLPIFVHPVVTSIVLGNPTTNCTTDPTTQCCPLYTTGTPVTAPAYAANSCISQGTTAQLVARVFAGTGAGQTNISCLSGHLSYSFGTSSVGAVDQNGVVTANQPGSTLVQANISNAVSSAGFFSTCPPASITLSVPGTAGLTNPVVVNQNNTQPMVATILDTNNVPLNGLTLEYVSTSPDLVPVAATGSVTPSFAGSAAISAICQPPACNTASYNEIGLFGNGKPIASNSINFSAPGSNGTVLFMGSTQSQYLVPIDFTTSGLGSPFRLPYVPNSMVISNDGYTMYLGSSTELMVVTDLNTLGLSREDLSSPGTVLGISPDGSTIAISDPVRQTISLETTAGALISTYGGVGTHAEWASDNQTVYISAGSQILVFSNFTGWTSIPASTPVTDVAVTVPGVGAYFAGQTTSARGYCSASTAVPATGVATETNVFYPLADTASVTTDRLSATNDGLHILGATVTPKATLNDLRVTIPIGACPTTGGLTFKDTPVSTVLSPITATAITGVVPATDSSIAFVTYTGSGGVLPAYAPTANGLGTTTYIKLSGTAIAPLAGVLSGDNTTFYTGTSGDNLVHLINRSTLTDSSTIAPKLTDPNNNPVPVNLIAQRTRKTT